MGNVEDDVRFSGVLVFLFFPPKIRSLRDAIMSRDSAMHGDEMRVYGISRIEDLLAKVMDMVTIGDRLVWLCSETGVGSLLFLSRP